MHNNIPPTIGVANSDEYCLVPYIGEYICAGVKKTVHLIYSIPDHLHSYTHMQSHTHTFHHTPPPAPHPKVNPLLCRYKQSWARAT